MCAGLRCAVLAGLLTFAASSGAAEPPVRQVLMLQSFDRGNLNLDRFTGNFRVDLEQRAGGPVNFVQVVVGQTGLVGAPEQSVVDYISSTFADRPKPDLVVTIAGPASVFARKYRQQLFPDVPLLFASVDQRFLGDAQLRKNETAVAALNDFPAIVEDILRLLPQTKQVFMVVGNGPIREFWRHRLEEQFGQFRGRVTFVWFDEFTFPAIVRRSSSLPENSAIYFITLGTDASGAAYADERVLTDLHASANAPLFAANDVFLGHGIVGGSLLANDELSRRASDVAYRILTGASPADVRVPPQLPGQPVFDWRELKRWNIPESRLPEGSLVKFRDPTLWNAYRGTVLTAIGALLIQAMLIVGLLLERRARHRAENASRMNLSLAADVSRRETMSALTSSITHELGQPLSAIMHNTHALQSMIKTSATREEIGEILSDIKSESVLAADIIERHRTMMRSRQLQMKPVDLLTVVNDAVALVAHDMRARQVEVSVSVPASSGEISGDPVLLQQVFVILMMNAMDAMAPSPPDQRHIQISAEVGLANIEVSVRDTGPGLPEDLIGRLFTPFLTTKPHGLGIGLAIARTLVDAHGGSITARNNPEGGAIFIVTLRTSKNVR